MAESIGLAMPQAATLMMSAADAIERLEDENAKLRNEVDNLLDFEHLTSVAVAYAGCDECGEYKQTMLRLFAENAKLQELVCDVHEALRTDKAGMFHKMILASMEDDMRELGIEVDNG